jgi:hypothetical protein
MQHYRNIALQRQNSDARTRARINTTHTHRIESMYLSQSENNNKIRVLKSNEILHLEHILSYNELYIYILYLCFFVCLQYTVI